MMMMITMEFMIYKMLSHLIQLSKKIRMEMELVTILIQIITQTGYVMMFFFQANFFHQMEMVSMIHGMLLIQIYFQTVRYGFILVRVN